MVDIQSSSDEIMTPPGIEPLTTLIAIRGGQEVVVTTSGESGSDETAQAALSVFGAWSDLDWDEAAERLSQIRHESIPTEPFSE